MNGLYLYPGTSVQRSDAYQVYFIVAFLNLQPKHIWMDYCTKKIVGFMTDRPRWLIMA